MKAFDAHNDNLLELVLPAVETGLEKRKLKISSQQKAVLVKILIREFRVRQEVVDRWLDMAEVLVKGSNRPKAGD